MRFFVVVQAMVVVMTLRLSVEVGTLVGMEAEAEAEAGVVEGMVAAAEVGMEVVANFQCSAYSQRLLRIKRTQNCFVVHRILPGFRSYHAEGYAANCFLSVYVIYIESK